MSKEDWKNNTIPNIFPDLPKVESILDVGCGLSLKSKFIPAAIRVGVDIYPEYFKHIEADVPYVVMKYDVRNLEEIFLPKSFDMVIILDVVEHLEKNESLRMIAQCERIARKAVIIETPEGFIPQNIDITGHGGHEFQSHRSGWTVQEFEDLGYTVKARNYVMDDVRRHTDHEVKKDIILLDTIKLL